MKERKRTERIDEAPALSIWQPWAHAIVAGLKRLETRSRATNHRGLILIHASKRWTSKEQAFHRESSLTVSSLLGADHAAAVAYGRTPPLGCIVAVADLVRVSHAVDFIAGWRRPGDEYIERLFGDFTAGRSAWHLANVVALADPVPCSGKQGIWRPDAATVDAVREQIGGAA